MENDKDMCIKEEAVKTIVEHELSFLERDLSGIRRILFWVGTIVITGLFGVGVWVGTIDSEVSTIKEKQTRFEDRVEAKLERIENLLIELNKEISSIK
jgi:hypothetical protein